MYQERKENFKPEPRESVKIEVHVENMSDPINDLICSKCIVYVNCSESCEDLKEIYSRIGQEFYDEDYIYQPQLMRTEGTRKIILEKTTRIINEYLKEKEIYHGSEGDT